MSTLEWLWHRLEINTKKLAKQEYYLLEAELYRRIHQEIWENYQNQYKDYFHLMKVYYKKEDAIMELYVIRCLINDLIKSKAYTLSGIAKYTQLPEELIIDLLINNKVGPLITFPRRLIELHKCENPDIYHIIFEKLILDTRRKEKINCHLEENGDEE